ncbi:hypothetical protein OGAPHI_002175 [Ogataea philodendri]|uniref:Serine/threonine-protein kinase TEL1 n=2 Tax=Saccharomycotina TaxID=147537 RepID=A0A9P8T7X7_9ASCO|nr:uncharacterized protein OGAPHI_002175 [Ogataea philodendri]KAH3668421.1 hypothetical protein OGAPHI_002175 [Ogataea philodendri]
MSGSGASGNKFRMSLALPTGAIMNCADNSGARNLYVLAVKGTGARLNRLPAASVGDMVMATVKKGKPDLRKKVMPAIVVRQSKAWRRKDGVFLYFEDNAGVIVNPKGEMKGSAITGPVGKECADLWPRIASNSARERLDALNEIADSLSLSGKANGDLVRLALGLFGFVSLDLESFSKTTESDRAYDGWFTRLSRACSLIRVVTKELFENQPKHKFLQAIVLRAKDYLTRGYGTPKVLKPTAVSMATIIRDAVTVQCLKDHLLPADHRSIIKQCISCLKVNGSDDLALRTILLQTIAEYVVPERTSSMELVLTEPDLAFKPVLEFCEETKDTFYRETQETVYVLRILGGIMKDCTKISHELTLKSFELGVTIADRLRTVSMAGMQKEYLQFIEKMGPHISSNSQHEHLIHSVLCSGFQVCLENHQYCGQLAGPLSEYLKISGSNESQPKKRKSMGISKQLSDLVKQNTNHGFMEWLLLNIMDLDRNVAYVGLVICSFWIKNGMLKQCTAEKKNQIANDFLQRSQVRDPLLNRGFLECLTVLESAPDVELDFDTVVGIALGRIKDPNYGNMACALFTTVLEHRKKRLITDFRNSVSQLQTIIDVPELNGPATISQESTKFWKWVEYLCRLGFEEYRRYFADDGQLLGTKIISWMAYKEYKPKDESEPVIIGGFIKWLQTSINLKQEYSEKLKYSLGENGTKHKATDTQTVNWLLVLYELGIVEEGQLLEIEPRLLFKSSVSTNITPNLGCKLEALPEDRLQKMLNNVSDFDYEACAQQVPPLTLLDICERFITREATSRDPSLFSIITPLLSNYETKTSERTIIVICRFLSYFHFDYNSEDSVPYYVLQYLEGLREKQMVDTSSATSSLIKLYSEDPHRALNEDLQKGLLFRLFQQASCYVKLETVSSLSNLMSAYSMDYYSKLMDCFRLEEGSLENRMVFCECCCIMSQRSEELMLMLLCNMLELFTLPAFADIIPGTIQKMASYHGDAHGVFDRHKLMILKAWLGFKLALPEFPHALFFGNYTDFVRSVYRPATALYLAYGGTAMIEKMADVWGMSAREMVRDSASLAVALAWTSKGVKQQIQPRITKFISKQELEEQTCLILREVLNVWNRGWSELSENYYDSVVAAKLTNPMIYFQCIEILSEEKQYRSRALKKLLAFFPDILAQKSIRDLYVFHFCNEDVCYAAEIAAMGEMSDEIWMAISQAALNEGNKETTSRVMGYRSKFVVGACSAFLLEAVTGLLYGRIVRIRTKDIARLTDNGLNERSIGLLSAIFDKLTNFPGLELPKPQVAQKLFEIQSSHELSPNFRQWIGNYLAMTYLKHGDCITTSFQEPYIDVFPLVTKKTIDLQLLITELDPGDSHMATKFSYLKMCAVLDSMRLNLEFPTEVFPMSKTVWRLYEDVPEDSIDLERPESFDPATFEREVLMKLASESTDPVSEYLRSFVYHDPSHFCLVILYLISTDAHIVKTVKTLLSNVFSADCAIQIHQKFTELVLLLRAGAIHGNRTHFQIYTALDTSRVYTIAAKTSPKAALMLMEEYFTNLQDSRCWKESHQWLHGVYSEIDEPDLFFGLPLETSLDYGIDRLKRTGNTAGQLMLESAKLETYGSVQNLGNTLFEAGFSALSKNVYQQENKFDNYDQFWKLGEWSLPVPEMKDQGTAMYSLLNVYQKDRSYENKFQELVQSYDRFCSNKKSHEWIKSLAMFCATQQRRIEPEEWLAAAPFETVEDLHLIRIASETGRAKFDDLSMYAKMCRQNGRFQKAATAAVTLDSLYEKFVADMVKPNDEALGLFCVAKFNVACAFWSQNEHQFALETLKSTISAGGSSRFINPGLIRAYMVKWLFESRQETSYAIMQQYMDPAETVNYIDNHDPEQYEMYHLFAEFCDNQLRDDQSFQRINKLKANVADKKAMLRGWEDYISDRHNTDTDRHKAKKTYQHIKLQYQAEKKELESATHHANVYLKQAVEFYILSVRSSVSTESRDIDRLCGLWLENPDVDISDSLLEISSDKFIPWLNQLTSRLTDTDDRFGSMLRQLILKICLDKPLHVLYLLKFMVNGTTEMNKLFIRFRSQVASEILDQFGAMSRKHAVMVSAVDEISTNCVGLAKERVRGTKNLSFKKLATGSWWIERFPQLQLPPPSLTLTKEAVHVARVDPAVSIASSGVSQPKIVKMVLSNGETHKMIVKGGSDDLRQDAIMQQVFEKVNVLLQENSDARRRRLRVRTYKIVPLESQAGVLEYVSNSVALNDILRPLHEHDGVSVELARGEMKEVQSSSLSRRVAVYHKLCHQIRPIFRNFFFNNYVAPQDWFQSRLIYSHGLATTSMVGHVLGIGDRHCNNILVDKSTGEPIHIDFGVAFDQGKVLPVPESVPFRLTRDLVDGLGICGTEGVFSRSCENVFSVLRSNSVYIIDILEVLRYDPLYSWTLSPVRRRRLQEDWDGEVETPRSQKPDTEAVMAIESVRNKLGARQLSEQAVVKELVRTATSEQNLAVMYLGWSPFL